MEQLLHYFQTNFPYWGEEQYSKVMALCQPRTFSAGDIFIRKGEFTTRGALVVEGCMRNYLLDNEGNEVTVVFATEYQQIAAYACVFLNRPSNEITEAIEPTTALVFDLQKLKQEAACDPLIAKAYTTVVEQAFAAAIQRIEDFTQTSPEERYVQLLEKQPHLLERIPLKYIASYLGMTFTSLSRIRKRVATRKQ